MNGVSQNVARAIADGAEGRLLASVDVEASPERVFRALTSPEITNWWIRPGVFDTREWEGDLRVNGRWRAAGMTRGQPYVQEGEFLTIEPPRRLVHTLGARRGGRCALEGHLSIGAHRGRYPSHALPRGLRGAGDVPGFRHRMGDQLRGAG